MMPDGSFGTPYSVLEARGAAKKHKDMDEYHRGLMLWLCDEVDRLNNVVPEDETTKSRNAVPGQDYASDIQLIQHALTFWANYIETGDIIMSAADMATRNRPAKYLTDEQKGLVQRLRNLAKKHSTRGGV